MLHGPHCPDPAGHDAGVCPDVRYAYERLPAG